MKVVFKVRKVVKKTVFLRSGSPVRVLWFFLSNLTFFDLILYHFIIGKIGPKVSHLLTVSSVPNSSDELIFVKRRALDGPFLDKNTGFRRALFGQKYGL